MVVSKYVVKLQICFFLPLLLSSEFVRDIRLMKFINMCVSIYSAQVLEYHSLL